MTTPDLQRRGRSGRTAALVAASLGALVSAAPARAQQANTYRDAILNVALGSGQCPQKIPRYLQIAQQALAAKQPWWAASGYASAAGCYAQQGQHAEAMQALRAAEKLGLDDCWFLRNDPMLKSLRSDAGFIALVRRTRMSRADFHEAVWLVKEVQHILHDANMMITENMNRPDGDWTLIPMSRIPSRRTKSMTIALMRMFVSGLQIYQRSLVMRSDQSRISHNTNMRIINRGGGPSQYAISLSRNQAQQRAQRRQAAVNARAYRASGLSNTPVSCSAL